MRKTWLLLLITFAASCVSADDHTHDPADPWAIETDASSEEDAPDPHPYDFYPDETAAHGERRVQREDVWSVAKLQLTVVLDGVRVEDGGYRPGTIVELSLPDTASTQPRRFHVRDERTWREVLESGHSWWWLDAWDGIDVIFGSTRGLNLFVVVPRSDIRRHDETQEILHHPLSDDILRDLARIEGRIVNEETGVNHPFELRTHRLERWKDRHTRYVRTSCVVGVSLIDPETGREIVECTR